MKVNIMILLKTVTTSEGVELIDAHHRIANMVAIDGLIQFDLLVLETVQSEEPVEILHYSFAPSVDDKLGLMHECFKYLASLPKYEGWVLVNEHTAEQQSTEDGGKE